MAWRFIIVLLFAVLAAGGRFSPAAQAGHCGSHVVLQVSPTAQPLVERSAPARAFAQEFAQAFARWNFAAPQVPVFNDAARPRNLPAGPCQGPACRGSAPLPWAPPARWLPPPPHDMLGLVPSVWPAAATAFGRINATAQSLGAIHRLALERPPRG